MNFDFLDRRSAERFAELLDTSAGRRHHARGAADESLAELVAIGHSLSAAKPAVRVDPDFRVGLRAMLVATAERDGIGRTAPADTAVATSDRVAAAQPGGRLGVLGLGGRRIRARGAIVIGVAAGALAVSGISAASENAAPGDALYGVKRSAERAQLAMAGSDVSRGQLSLDFARTRLAEATALAGDNAEFARVLDDMDADTRKGVLLLTTSAVAHRDTKPLGTVSDFAGEQRRTITPVLGRLNEPNRERALTSISLLESVQQRADDLRTGLGCASVTSIGSDLLGPRLRGCTAEPDGTTSGRPGGRNGKSSTRSTEDGSVRPRQGGPGAVAPGATAGTSVPGQQGSSVAPQITPGQSEAPADPADGGDNGVLGGLLGGILGGS